MVLRSAAYTNIQDKPQLQNAIVVEANTSQAKPVSWDYASLKFVMSIVNITYFTEAL